MKMTVIAAAVALVIGFGVGWTVNGARKDNVIKQAEIDRLTEQNIRAEESFDTINSKLGDVINKTEVAAAETQRTLDSLTTIRVDTNKAQEQVSVQTKRLDDEIAKLGVPKCQFDFNTGSLWRTTGERANSGRHALYGTETQSQN